MAKKPTPMIKQYRELKAEHPDAILMFRWATSGNV